VTLTRPLAALLALATVLNSVPAAAQRVVAPVVAPIAPVLPGMALRLPSVTPSFPSAQSAFIAPSLTLPAVRAVAAPAVAPAALVAKPVAAAQAAQAAAPALQAFTAQLADTKPSGDMAAAPLLGGFFDASLSKGSPSNAVVAERSAAEGSGVLLQRSLASLKELRVGTYNVLNLMEKVGKHVPDPASPGRMIKVSERSPKEEWQLREQAKAILESNLDVVALQEVETLAALEEFNARYLGGAYKTLLIEGNDPRGIDVAFLVKKDIPFEVEQRSHRGETWADPAQGGATAPIFSRDLTALVVRAPGLSKPLFVLLGGHFKSKRDRPGDPESGVLRAAQMERAAEVAARYKAEFGEDVPLMMAGDFNGDLNAGPEFAPLYGEAGLVNSLDLGDRPLRTEDRVTHTYHPKDGPSHFAQMDGVLVSKSLAALVRRSEVYRYKNADGSVKGIPRTYKEREQNPSDHFPLLMALDFQPLLRRVAPGVFGPEIQGRSGVTETPAPAAKPAAAPGERKLAFLGMLWSFLAIASMYIVMPVRSAFLLTQHGPDVLPWVFMASALFTGVAAWVYGKFSHRPRAQLLGGTLAVLGAGLVGWWLAAPLAMASAPVSFAFSMWTDAFSIMSVTLFWTYAADRFKGEAVKRWFGFFAAAGALGSIVGSGVTRFLVAGLGAPNLLLIAAGTFAAIGLVFWAMERTTLGPAASSPERGDEAAGKGFVVPAAPVSKGAWETAKEIASSPFLLALAALVFFERLVPDFMMYLFNLQAQQAYTTKESMAAFMAGFGMLAGAASLVTSAVATRWMLKKLGVGKTLLSAPLMSLLGFLAMGAAPTLPVTVGANLAEGLPRYTVFKAAKEATYSAADKDVLYRVKAYIEMFVYRFARGIAGLLLLFLTGPAFLAWGPAAVAWAAVPFALAWVYAAWRLAREHRSAEAATPAAPGGV
jgi:ATP/ADP translocase/endonuclease/exonuclease/phosphatase family metal-dependent hydrolase